jgi:hypothetical protein
MILGMIHEVQVRYGTIEKCAVPMHMLQKANLGILGEIDTQLVSIQRSELLSQENDSKLNPIII